MLLHVVLQEHLDKRLTSFHKIKFTQGMISQSLAIYVSKSKEDNGRAAIALGMSTSFHYRCSILSPLNMTKKDLMVKANFIF